MIETTIIDRLRATLTGPPPVYPGVAPQGEDDAEIFLPVVIVNRIGSEWPATFCGTDLSLSLVTIQIDFYARSAEMSRRHADEARAALTGLPDTPTLSNEFTAYEPAERAWRVVQTWLAPDNAPTV